MLDRRSHRADRASRFGRSTIFGFVALAIAAFLWRGTPIAKVAKSGLRGLASATADTRTSRKVYPLSVIYGGAYSGEELARARNLDSVVARHYAGFGSSPAVLRMPKDALMYVSYRKADQVFWTKTRHKIPKGETVLSDGQSLARVRCGNRLSPKPQAPIASEQEPTEEALDFPDKPKAPLTSATPVPSAADADFFVPSSPGDLPSSLAQSGPASPPMLTSAIPGLGSDKPYAFGSNPSGAGPFLGQGLFYPAASGTSAGSSTGAPGSSNVIVNIPAGIALAVPEPNTVPLLLIGMLLGSPALLRRWRNRATGNPGNK